MASGIGTPSNVKIECPFCKELSIDAIYYPPVNQINVSSAAGKKVRKMYTTRTKYEINSGCSNCGKPKKEIEKAFKEGTPADKERQKKRYEEVMKLREELRREREGKK